MIFSTAAEMLFPDREAVHGFVETPQNVFGGGAERHRNLLDSMTYRVPRQITKCRTYRKGKQITSYPVCPRYKICMEREYMAFCDRCGQKLAWDRLSEW